MRVQTVHSLFCSLDAFLTKVFFNGRGEPPPLYICYPLLKIMGLDYTRVVKKTVRGNLGTISLPYPSMQILMSRDSVVPRSRSKIVKSVSGCTCKSMYMSLFEQIKVVSKPVLLCFLNTHNKRPASCSQLISLNQSWKLQFKGNAGITKIKHIKSQSLKLLFFIIVLLIY